jgi:aryl-alcohol dehydrogenase-like predicted oxidoreductase
VIVGPESVEELRSDATAADVRLSTEQLDVLTALAVEPPAFRYRAGDGPRQPASASFAS